MFSTHPLDWGVIAIYVAFLAAVWLRDRRTPSPVIDYLVAGRRLTLPAFVATLVATWYGGILGIGEYTWRHGVSNWLVFGVPYYVGAFLFAMLFARRARESRLFTIPDLLAERSGRAPALLGALLVFLTSIPAAYVLMLGTLFAAMTGAPLIPCVLVAGALSLFYVDRGGLRTVVLTDQVQFVLMYLGFGMLFAFLVFGYGARPLEPGVLPPTHFTWHGGNPPQAIWVWYFIALSALVDPGFWQRAYAARSPEVAREGVLWSIAFWIVFDLMTTTAGLYARALLPDLADPVQAFPQLGRLVLPPLALGVFYLGMIATVMSTIDSYGFIAASTVGRDVVWRLRRRSRRGTHSVLHPSRTGGRVRGCGRARAGASKRGRPVARHRLGHDSGVAAPGRRGAARPRDHQPSLGDDHDGRAVRGVARVGDRQDCFACRSLSLVARTHLSRTRRVGAVVCDRLGGLTKGIACACIEERIPAISR